MKWGHADIVLLINDAKAGYALPQLAQRNGASARECDLALWAKVGRTVEQTCDVLNGRRAA